MMHEMSKPFVLALVESSDYHKWWGDAEVRKYVDVPMELGQYAVFCNTEYTPIGYASWGFPSEAQVQKYLIENVFPVDAFDGGGNTLWIVDFICFGGKSNITKVIRQLRDMFVEMGYDQAMWLRTETGKLGWLQVKEK